MTLRVDWCSAKAARYAATHWHYSKSVPAAKSVRIGVWWADEFRGSIVFSIGANRNQAKLFGMKDVEVCELARVALTDHPEFQVTQALACAIRLLKRRCPGLKVVVSFADTTEGHHGGIYQAGNWIYTGKSNPSSHFLYGGKKLHKRAYTGRAFGGGRKELPKGAIRVRVPGKHRYVMPLDKKTRRRLKVLAQPYPERSTGDDADAR